MRRIVLWMDGWIRMLGMSDATTVRTRERKAPWTTKPVAYGKGIRPIKRNNDKGRVEGRLSRAHMLSVHISSCTHGAQIEDAPRRRHPRLFPAHLYSSWSSGGQALGAGAVGEPANAYLVQKRTTLVATCGDSRVSVEGDQGVAAMRDPPCNPECWRLLRRTSTCWPSPLTTSQHLTET